MDNNYLTKLPIDIATEISKFLEYDDLKNLDKICHNIDYTRLFYQFEVYRDKKAKSVKDMLLYRDNIDDVDYQLYFTSDKNKNIAKDIIKKNETHNMGYKILYTMLLRKHNYLHQMYLWNEIKNVCSIELYRLIVDNNQRNEIEKYDCFDEEINIEYFDMSIFEGIVLTHKIQENVVYVEDILVLYPHQNYKQLCDYFYKNYKIKREGRRFHEALDSMFENMYKKIRRCWN